jgi:hypothetical protein
MLVEYVHTIRYAASLEQTQHDTCSANANAIGFGTIQAFQPPFYDDPTHQAKGGCFAV